MRQTPLRIALRDAGDADPAARRHHLTDAPATVLNDGSTTIRPFVIQAGVPHASVEIAATS